MNEDGNNKTKEGIRQFADTKVRIHPDLSEKGMDLSQFVNLRLEKHGITLSTAVRLSPFGSVMIDSDGYAEALGLMSERFGDSGEDFLEYCQRAHSLFAEDRVAHLRSTLYYHNDPDGLQNEFRLNKEVFNLINQHTNLDETGEFGDNEQLIVLSILDYIRDLGLKVRYAMGFSELSGLTLDPACSRDIISFANTSTQAYYEYFLTGTVSTPVLRELMDSFNSDSLPNFIGENSDYFPQKPRELDHPLEIIASALEIINSGNFYDLAIDFPYGSIGLAHTINSISLIVSGIPIIGSIQESYMSSYRAQQSTMSPPTSPNREQTSAKPMRILILDDNLVSGGTIIIARKLLEEHYGPFTIIDAAVIELYAQGINDWQDGLYQFLTENQLYSVLSYCDDASLRVQIISRLFDPPNHVLSQLGIMPIDNKGNSVDGNYLMWKPMLKPEDFDFLKDLGYLELYNLMIRIYGFQSYSAIYNETLQQLDYYPVAELKIDDLPGYIDSLN